jgi:hypothetical protein
MSSQNTPSHENGPFQPRPTRGPLRDSTMGYSICEPKGVTKVRCPVFWSRMKYSPGDDSASFRMRSLAVSRFATASRQSTLPPLILKMSREGTMFCPPPFLGRTLLYHSGVTRFCPFWHRFLLVPERQKRSPHQACGLFPTSPSSGRVSDRARLNCAGHERHRRSTRSKRNLLTHP